MSSRRKPMATPNIIEKNTSCRIEPLLNELKMFEGMMFTKKSTSEDCLVPTSCDGS